jgi:hypothetical protein
MIAFGKWQNFLILLEFTRTNCADILNRELTAYTYPKLLDTQFFKFLIIERIFYLIIPSLEQTLFQTHRLPVLPLTHNILYLPPIPLHHKILDNLKKG